METPSKRQREENEDLQESKDCKKIKTNPNENSYSKDFYQWVSRTFPTKDQALPTCEQLYKLYQKAQSIHLPAGSISLIINHSQELNCRLVCKGWKSIYDSVMFTRFMNYMDNLPGDIIGETSVLMLLTIIGTRWLEEGIIDYFDIYVTANYADDDFNSVDDVRLRISPVATIEAMPTHFMINLPDDEDRARTFAAKVETLKLLNYSRSELLKRLSSLITDSKYEKDHEAYLHIDIKSKILAQSEHKHHTIFDFLALCGYKLDLQATLEDNIERILDEEGGISFSAGTVLLNYKERETIRGLLFLAWKYYIQNLDDTM